MDADLAPPRAVVADRTPLVRLGVTALVEPLGIDVVAECPEARDALERAAADRVALVVAGLTADLATADVVRRAHALPARPAVVALLPDAAEGEVPLLAALGTEGLVRRRAPADEIAEVVARVMKGEHVVAPALQRMLAGRVRLRDDDGTLSARERQVLGLLADGRTNREIAERLSVTPATVKSHLVHVYAKLGVTSRHEALAAAVARGLLA